MPYKEPMRPTHLSLLVVAAAACRPSAPEAPVQDSTPPVVPVSEDTDAPIPADSPDEAPAPDLLLNGSFETEDAWAVWGGAERVEAHATDGTWSLRATRENGAEQVVTDLLPNAIYRLSGWGRTRATSPCSSASRTTEDLETRLVFTDATYREDALYFTTGFSHTSAVIYAYKHAGDAAGYADQLTLTLESDVDQVPIWADEFDGSGPLDDTKWGYEEGFVRNQELQWYQADNATRESGYLIIEGRRAEAQSEPSTRRDGLARAARLHRLHICQRPHPDRLEWTYGRLVVRAKVTGATGTWPAIWTLGIDCDWPSNGEVDVMENYGGDLLANFAWGSNQPWSPVWSSSRLPLSELPPDWTEQFHIWEYHWTASQLAITLDGQLLHSVQLDQTFNGTAACAGDNPFHQPHYLLLNLALGSNGGPVDGLVFPTRYIIDYVRLYP